MASPGAVPTSAEQQRARALLAMGFSEIQALLLAATRPEDGDLDLDRLRRMLAAGCDHDLAMRILL
jgi:hypothetical protein